MDAEPESAGGVQQKYLQGHGMPLICTLTCSSFVGVGAFDPPAEQFNFYLGEKQPPLTHGTSVHYHMLTAFSAAFIQILNMTFMLSTTLILMA